VGAEMQPERAQDETLLSRMTLYYPPTPAVEHWYGSLEWWVNGLRHRCGCPAVVGLARISHKPFDVLGDFAEKKCWKGRHFMA
jgi:hypothetical protein